MPGSRKHTFRKLLLRSISLAFIAGTLHAEDRAILVSGGDASDTVANWRRGNLKKVAAKLEDDDFSTEIHFHKDTLEMAIADARRTMKCGDKLILYFNGHGSKDAEFLMYGRKQSGSPDLHAEELKEWLQGFAPCVKIYIVFYACYSGEIIYRLKDNDQIVMAVSSSGKTYTTTREHRICKYFGEDVKKNNWTDSFEAGLRLTDNLADDFIRAADNAYSRAKKFNNNPQVFLRGHVEQVEKASYYSDKYRVTIKAGNDIINILTTTKVKSNLNPKRCYLHWLEFCYDIEVFGRARFEEGHFLAYRSSKYVRTECIIVKFPGRFEVVNIISIDEDYKKLRVRFESPGNLGGANMYGSKTEIIVFVANDEQAAGIEEGKRYTCTCKERIVYKEDGSISRKTGDILATDLKEIPQDEKKEDKPRRYGFRMGVNTGRLITRVDDFDTSGQSIAYMEEYSCIESVFYEKFTGSTFVGFDVCLTRELGKGRAGLGTGFRYYPGGVSKEGWNGVYDTMERKQDISAWSVPITATYSMPVKHGWPVWLRASVGIELTKLTNRYDHTLRMLEPDTPPATQGFTRSSLRAGLDEEFRVSGKLKDTGIGFHFGLNVEYPLSEKCVISLGALYNILEFDRLEGRLTDSDGIATDMLLVMKDDFGRSELDHRPLTDPGDDARAAVVRLTGFRIDLSLEYLLDFQKLIDLF